MPIIVDRSELRGAIDIAAIATKTRSTLAILQHCVLSAKNGLLTVFADDLELGCRTSLPCSPAADESLTLHTADLQAVLGKFDGEAVTITTSSTAETANEPAAYRTTLKCGKASVKLPGLDPDEYPKPAEERQLLFETDATLLADVLARMQKAVAGSDASRPMLSGVHVLTEDGKVRFCATDTHRLHVAWLKVPDAREGSPLGYIIPARAVAAVLRLFKHGPVRVLVGDDRRVWFSSESVEVVTRLIDGSYPDPHRVIPDETNRGAIVECDRKELLHAIDRASIVAMENAGRVEFQFNEAVHIRSKSIKGTVEEKVEATCDVRDPQDGDRQPPDLCCMNARYLLDTLAAMHSTRVRWYAAPLQAGMMLETDRHAEIEAKYLLMPMSI